MFVNKRKAFNSKNKRFIDSDHANLVKQAEKIESKKAKAKEKEQEQEIKKVPKWKKQSEEFRRILGAGKPKNEDEDNFIVTKKGNEEKIQQPTTSCLYDDYTHCNICNRRYNEDAFKKHLPTCQRKQKEQIMKGGNKPISNQNQNLNQLPNTKNGFNKKK